MKKDNRGFLLAESLVVSTFVLTVLILLYIQFSNLITNYKNSYNYNNVESIYDLASVADYLQVNNYNLSNSLTSDKPYIVLYEDGSCTSTISDIFCADLISNMKAKKIIYTYSDISIIKDYVDNNNDGKINQSLREFITRVETNTVLNKGRLFAEFENGTYATIAMDNEIVAPDIPEEPTTLTTAIGGVEVNVVTSGTGLYSDNGKYVYKGTNPNNYLNFNGEKWRIISKESDNSLKIMRVNSLNNMAWDSSNKINYSNSSLNTYLNNTYLNTLDQTNIIRKTFSIGTISDTSLEEQNKNESALTSDSKVGLITASEYIKANSNISSCATLSSIRTHVSECKTTNWMIPKTGKMWTITPYTPTYAAAIASDGNIEINNNPSNANIGVYPVLYLSSNVSLTGTGTETDSFKIGG